MMFPLNHGVMAAVAEGGPGGQYTVTVAPGTVGSDLVSFPLMVDLRDMPAAFWEDVNETGGNIRVYASDGSTAIPHDVAAIDKRRKTGLLFAKVGITASAGAAINVGVGEPSATALPEADVNGRNAVWSDYVAVVVGPSLVNRTGGTDAISSGTISANMPFAEIGRSPGLSNAKQGFAMDAEYYYITDTNHLSKFDYSWNLLLENTDPVGDVIAATGDSSLNHGGDPCIVDGEIYLPVENFTGGSVYESQYLAVFNTLDLNLDRVIDISSAGREAGSVCLGPGGNLYVGDWADGSSIPFFDLFGNLLGELELSDTLLQINGITFFNGKFYVTAGKVYEVEQDGTVVGGVYQNTYNGGILEGIDNDGNNLYQLRDNGGISAVFTLSDQNRLQEWLALDNANIYFDELPPSDIWTMSITEYLLRDGQRTLVSLSRDDSTSIRANLVSDDNPARITGWNSSDAWMSPSALIVPTEYQKCHASLSHNGTVERKTVIDGDRNATDSEISSIPGGTGNRWQIGSSTTGSEYFVGHVGVAALRYEYLSDEWLAAEAANRKDPSSFYSVSVPGGTP